ncbi:importin subunit beta-1 [Babesia caballi]|uniref:Importin subunit beta-1 n=1 Tax=Babesia caballi TaxID=5871 RepID=A0AAV4M1T8_BABCB|nr:importin subunit beta-1 [Babesia caballi]
MTGSGGAGRAPASHTLRMPEQMREIVLQYVDRSDRCVLETSESTAISDRAYQEAALAAPSTPSTPECHLEAKAVENELDRLPFEGKWIALRRRIEELVTAAAALDKHLAAITQRRHGELVVASVGATNATEVRKLCERNLPQLRRSFEAYSNSSLRNALSLPRAGAQLANIRRLSNLLANLDNLRGYGELVRRHDLDTHYRILAAAVAVDAIERVTACDPTAAKLVILRTMREAFTNRLQTMARNCAMKLDAGLGFASSVRLFHLLGLPPEAAAERVLCGYRRQLFGLLLSAVQRYANVDAGCSAPGSGRSNPDGFAVTQESQAQSRCLSELARCARLLGPNMILLTICKALSEFATFFGSALAGLRRVPPPGGSGASGVPDSLQPIHRHIAYLDESGMHSYFKSVSSLVRRNFVSVRAYACSLLATVIGDVNIAAAKDRNDYLKLGLLLRFFITAQTECISTLSAPPAKGEEADSKLMCAMEDVAVRATDLDGVRRVLFTSGTQALATLAEDGFHCSLSDATSYVESLEEAICAKLLTPYMERFYQETLEKLRMCAAGETYQRLQTPDTAVCAGSDVFALHRIFAERVRQSMECPEGVRMCALNPYNGWTPSGAFIGVNIESWPLGSPLHRGGSVESAGRRDQRHSGTEDGTPCSMQIPGCTRADSGTRDSQRSQPADTSDFSREERLAACRNFGCVFTASSFTVWSQLPELFRVLVLQPQRAYLHLPKLLSAFDWLLMRSIRDCRVPPSQRQLPHLNEFMFEYRFVQTEPAPDAERETSLSTFSQRVNAAESVATLLELLRRRVEFGCQRCADVMEAYYDRRAPVLSDLRSAVYPLCMLSLLQKRLPAEGILELLNRDGGAVPELCSDITEFLSAFAEHVRHVREFVEAADGGSIPLPVKALLWRHAYLMAAGALRPVLDFVNRRSVHYDIASAVTGGCEWAVERVMNVYRSYRGAAQAEWARHRHLVAHLAAYESLVHEMANSWD